jgi:hypothetical protein
MRLDAAERVLDHHFGTDDRIPVKYTAPQLPKAPVQTLEQWLENRPSTIAAREIQEQKRA